MDLEETVLEIVVLNSCGSGEGQMADSCQHDNDPTGVRWSDMVNINVVPLLNYLCAVLCRV